MVTSYFQPTNFLVIHATASTSYLFLSIALGGGGVDELCEQKLKFLSSKKRQLACFGSLSYKRKHLCHLHNVFAEFCKFASNMLLYPEFMLLSINTSSPTVLQEKQPLALTFPFSGRLVGILHMNTLTSDRGYI